MFVDFACFGYFFPVFTVWDQDSVEGTVGCWFQVPFYLSEDVPLFFASNDDVHCFDCVEVVLLCIPFRAFLEVFFSKAFAYCLACFQGDPSVFQGDFEVG